MPPKQFVQGEWFVATAALTGFVWLVVYQLGASIALSAGIAFVIGYAFRVTALYRAWEEPLAKEPTGVYKHDDGRPMLGRKLKDKSKRELDYLGLAVHKDEGNSGRLDLERTLITQRRVRSENRRCPPRSQECCSGGRPPCSAGSRRRGKGRTRPSGP